jgi:cell wall assembly regulator SMI1
MTARDLFTRYTAWLQKHVPAAHANLAPPATTTDLDALEKTIGCTLDEDVKTILRLHNGQRQTMLVANDVVATPCLPTLSFLSTQQIAAAWHEWDELRRETDAKELEELQACGGVFPGARGLVKPLYTSPGWIPLWADPQRADYVGLDLDPDTNGTRGQIINFGRDEERHFLCAPSFVALLEILIAEVESGAWPASEIQNGEEKLPWFGVPKSHFFVALHKRFAGKQKS